MNLRGVKADTGVNGSRKFTGEDVGDTGQLKMGSK